MQVFYGSEINTETDFFSFDKDESKHIVRVLRKSEGDKISLINGKGFLFEGEIVSDSEKKCEVRIINHRFFQPTSYWLHLAVAPTKNNDRYQWFLEKATEIGVHEITPIICEHSERKIIKTERLEKTIISATKQSLQYYIPKLNKVKSFSDFIKSEKHGQLYIAHCGEFEKKNLVQEVIPNEKITILIGPEGDFSKNEIQSAISLGYESISLGNSRLRTETAAIYTTSVVAIKQEQLNFDRFSDVQKH